MKIAGIVCPNGLGHFKRLLSITKLLFAHTKPDSLSLDVFCCRWQYEALLEDVIYAEFIKTHVKPVYAMEVCGVKWQKETHAYTSASLMDWVGYINALYKLKQYDIVLSDNLVQVLKLRPDAVLIGTFIWSDVFAHAFPGFPVIQQFVSLEQELLTKYNPPMVSDRYLAMPSILDRTDVQLFDWFCDPDTMVEQVPNRSRDNRKLKLGLFGGATDTQRNALQQFASALTQQSKYRLFMRRQDLLPMINAEAFEFKPSSWAGLDAAIVRAGAGTLTDCVSYIVPCFTILEDTNMEMYHNSLQIQRLGLGKRLDVFDADSTERLNDYLLSDDFETARENIKNQPRNGLKQAAKWIAEHYNLELVKEL